MKDIIQQNNTEELSKKEKKKAYDRAYNVRNAVKIKARNEACGRAYRMRKEVKAKAIARYEANKDKMNANRRYRMLHDPLYKFIHSIRAHTTRAFRRIKQNKPTKTINLLGCSWEEAQAHFEKLFQPGMTWSNHGEWHIDHIIPIATAQTIEDACKLNHISNLQPLWAKDNLTKGAKLA
jgi:hypothetical protein